MKNATIKNYIESSFSNEISKNTIIGIINSVLKPIAFDNVNALILSRIRNTGEIESLIKRLKYSENINFKDLTDKELLTNDDFKTVEFLLVTSARFNIFIAWDFENSNNNKSKIFFLTNSRLINDCFEIISKRLKEDLSDEFYSYKPERRENILLNEILTNIIDILNENVLENEFINNEELLIAEKLEKLDNLKEISHEIKNQLSIIEINSKIIEKKYENINELNTINKAIEIIKYNLNEIKNINLKENKASVLKIIEEVISIENGNLREKNNEVSINNSIKKEYLISEEKLKGALLNIIQNANDATKDDTIEINAKMENNYIEIYVANHGEPIEENNQFSIFDSGYTTKENGWGIGLYITKKNIEKLGGEIRLNISNKEKTEFLIKLPIKENLQNEIYV